MSILKTALAAALAGGAAVAISATAFAVTTSPSPSASPTPTPVPGAGPLTIKLTCDTGPGGSGTFTVTANGKSSTVSVTCGKSASVSNTAWKAGSTAVIHQTAATAAGQLKALDVSIKLTAAGETVAIRNFRSSAAAVATLAQTGGGVPALPIGLALGGLLLAVIGGGVLTGRLSAAAQR